MFERLKTVLYCIETRVLSSYWEHHCASHVQYKAECVIQKKYSYTPQRLIKIPCGRGMAYTKIVKGNVLWKGYDYTLEQHILIRNLSFGGLIITSILSTGC